MFAQCRPNPARFGPILKKIGPASVDLGAIWTRFGLSSAKPGSDSQILGRCLLELANMPRAQATRLGTGPIRGRFEVDTMLIGVELGSLQGGSGVASGWILGRSKVAASVRGSSGDRDRVGAGARLSRGRFGVDTGSDVERIWADVDPLRTETLRTQRACCPTPSLRPALAPAWLWPRRPWPSAARARPRRPPGSAARSSSSSSDAS